MRKILFGFLFFISALGFATHNRAGEILYTRIAPYTTVVAGVTVPIYTYSIVIITYTDDGYGIADRCEDTVYFGDGAKAAAHRINGSTGAACQCPNSDGCGVVIIAESTYRVKKNIYSVIHSYSGAGTYTIRFYDPNRNANVANIPNSVNQPFYVESQLIINSFTGANSSPQFLYDPIDRACVDRCFTHNPGAYDPDGDSLSYEITTCRVNVGETVPGYTYPDAGAGGQFNINAITGLLTWCSPQAKAEYNIAFIVKEWRKNLDGDYNMIGYMIRDMQVVVDVCPNNHPPVVTAPADTCVEAGTFITKKIKVSDPDIGNTVTLSGQAGAFAAPAPTAILTNTSGVILANNGNSYYSTFSWQTTCNHVRQQPYECVFKAQDNGAPVELATYGSYNIKVIPTSVKNVTATPAGTTIRVSWQPSSCSPAANALVGYKVYRKNDCSVFIPIPCETGVLPSSGFVLIGQTNAAVSSYTDTNNGNGLVVGQNYSYLVIAIYEDGTETFASNQVCARLKRDIPLMLNVSVRSTDTDTGSVYLRWTRPLTTAGNFDTATFHGPYVFNLKYRDSGSNAAFSQVFTSTNIYFAGLDTQYVHRGINTVGSGKEYLIEFLANNTTIGSSQLASSVFLHAVPDDRKIHLQWSSKTPWNNTIYKIMRKAPATQTFVQVGQTSDTLYTDTSRTNDPIINGNTYCYKIQSNGAYSDPSVYGPLLNLSQELCATAVDLTPPCTPTLTIDANCAFGTATVSWSDVRNLSCGDDVVKYSLFYKPTVNDTYSLIANGLSTTYIYDGVADSLISGCYAIQATDENNNVSPMSPDFCIDNCPIFELPNIFTPNKDGTNDFFQAIRVRQIREINLIVFDRWGTPVYKTKDPYFHWDGISTATNTLVSEGTFFYICDVFEPRFTGTIKRTLKGTVTVMR